MSPLRGSACRPRETQPSALSLLIQLQSSDNVFLTSTSQSRSIWKSLPWRIPVPKSGSLRAVILYEVLSRTNIQDEAGPRKHRAQYPHRVSVDFS